mgnify:CR=1 FL=1
MSTAYDTFLAKLYENTPEARQNLASLNGLLDKASNGSESESYNAQGLILKAFEQPLRQGTLYGDIVTSLYKQVPQDKKTGRYVEFPLDIIAPGSEKNHVGYTIPKTGYIPHRMAEGDYSRIDVYKVANSITLSLDIVGDSRWDIVSRAMEVMEAGIVKKLNDDGMHVILAAAADRNILVFDSDALAGQFTRRLVSLMSTTMRRNGGGNSTSVNRGKLTHMLCSPEMFEDVRNFNINQVSDITRAQIFNMSDENIANLFGDVKLVAIDELGVGQEYQNYYTNVLGGSMAASDEEIIVGLDLIRPYGLTMPVVGGLETFVDDNLHRHQQMGYYCWRRVGFGCLDNRVVLLASA